MTHSDIIGKFGGTRHLMEALNTRVDPPLALSSVSVWHKRGIPWAYRSTIAQMAATRGILLPGDFLLPDTQRRGKAAA